MSSFKKSLPVQIHPLENNPEGIKFQGSLEAMEQARMKIKMDPSLLSEPFGYEIRVEFTISNYNFKFESAVLPDVEAGYVFIRKPKVVQKSRIRKSPRVKTSIKFNYSKWEESIRHAGAITDLSAVGLKMSSRNLLPKNSIISVSVFIPDSALRLVCQGLVIWSRADQNQNNLFWSGIKFTTLSEVSTKKLEKYIDEHLHLQESYG